MKHRTFRITGGRAAMSNTSRLTDDEIIMAIRHLATEIDVDGVVFHFKGLGQGKNWGRAYPSIPMIANMDGLDRSDWNYLVIVRDHEGWVSTLAHEAKHIEQFRRGTLRREKKARNCEAQARAFGRWFASEYDRRGS